MSVNVSYLSRFLLLGQLPVYRPRAHSAGSYSGKILPHPCTSCVILCVHLQRNLFLVFQDVMLTTIVV